MRATASFMAIAIILALAASPGQAYDASRAEIIGLRLDMLDTEVLMTMRRQGFAVTHDHGALVARTRDGQLTVDLTDTQAVRRIRYVFTNNGVGETQKIEESILDRFGPPDQMKPMGWCLALSRDGRCAEDGPSLIFQPETLTLVLQSRTDRP
jgi:hypothetical protein